MPENKYDERPKLLYFIISVCIFVALLLTALLS